jgi:hypothetical protein
MCLNRFDTDTKTAFLDLYTKVDADATAPVPVAPKDDVQVETINDANSGDLMVRVTKNGGMKSVLLTAMDMIEHQGSGLTEQQVIDQVAKTLVAALNREANENPF